ncbi:hypothetical protein [Carbonactinospora thermoautotrophica]|uniref:hypothetical protein n=1 Tax=Carbonactinospora thermoautotrophica TaxID=1469144 RepID=UPI003DA9162D
MGDRDKKLREQGSSAPSASFERQNSTIGIDDRFRPYPLPEPGDHAGGRPNRVAAAKT